MRYRNIIDGRMNLDLKKSKLDRHMKEKKKYIYKNLTLFLMNIVPHFHLINLKSIHKTN